MSDFTNRIADLPPDKRALLELQLMKRRKTEPSADTSSGINFRQLKSQPSPSPTPSGATRAELKQARKKGGMDFSLFYFSADESMATGNKYRLLFEGAKFADRNDFTAIWTPERHFHSFGGGYPNPSVLAAALAMVTARIQLRAGSVVLPLHHPIRVAEEWSMVDNISNGRVGVAFASGWHANDFVFFPEKYTERRDIMMRDIETVQKLWQGQSVTAAAPNGMRVEMQIYPKPVQPELPIWITAAGTTETYVRAGRIGANTLTNLLGQSVEQLAEKIAIYRAARVEHWPGRGEGHVTLMLHTFIGDDLGEVREKVREPFCDYLRRFTNLLANLAQTLNLRIAQAAQAEDDMDALVSHAFKRYFGSSALFGTPDTCLEMIEHLKEIGVDEIACLIDFGVDDESVLESLVHLNELKERSNRGRQARLLSAT